MNMLCVVIESTCSAVIDVEAANCCGASNLKSGTPSPPLNRCQSNEQTQITGEGGGGGVAPFDRIVLGEVSRRLPLG